MRRIILICINFLLSIVVNAQPCTNVKEYNRKRHIISVGSNEKNTYGHPYSMFDKHNGYSFQATIENIRKRIISEIDLPKEQRPVYLAYQLLYTFASRPMPTDNGMHNEAPSGLALWAKNNAFVMLIGLNGNGDTLTLSDRENRKNNVLHAFNNLSANMNYTSLFGMEDQLSGLSPVGNLMPTNVLAIFQSFEKRFIQQAITARYIQHYSRSLSYWLVAYDLLKASAALPELNSIKYYDNYNSDANKDWCSPRNKLRNLTRNLYQMSKGWIGIVEHKWGWKKNHGIAAASTLLLAAQVLNDAGVETEFFNTWYSYLPIIGQIARVILQPLPHPKYSPINWNKLGSEGIRENLFEGKHWWPSTDVPVAPFKPWANDYSPYSEGPVYAEYGLLDCGMPAMRAQQNFYPNWSTEPLLKRNEINNIFNWLDAITVGDLDLPTYDNSGPENTSWHLALSNNPEFNYGTSPYFDENSTIPLIADYIALIGGNQISLNKKNKKEYDNKLALLGNVILRNFTEKGSYYFHMLAEHTNAIDKPSGILGLGGTHEENDIGSFMIYAGNKNKEMKSLIIDPPYFGWKDKEWTSKFEMHNVLKVNNNPNDFHILYRLPVINMFKISNNLSIKTFSLELSADKFGNDTLIRNVFDIKHNNTVYYLINDFINISADLASAGVTYTLNGNGRNDHLETYKKNNNLHVWSLPCHNLQDATNNIWVPSSNGWKIASHIAGIGSKLNSRIGNLSINASNTDNGTRAKINNNFTFISRLKFNQPNVSKNIYQSLYFPLRCDDELPSVYCNDSNLNFITTTIHFNNLLDTSITTQLYPGPQPNPNTSVNDTSCHFHYARFAGMEADTVYNPYNLPAHAANRLTLNAQKAFLRYQTWAESKNGYKYCPPSYLNLHHASITNGSYLQYNDTFIIKSTMPISADIAFAGRYNYMANINPIGTPGAADSVFLYLPDVAAGIDMVAKDYLTSAIAPCHYDSFTRTLAIAMPTENANFVIEEREKCQNCYFPPTALGIDTLFSIDDGRKHTISHKLTVKQGYGNLHLTNGSKIDMCAEVYLQNKDSIVIQGNCQQKPLYAPVCKGIDTALAYNNNSAIIIGNGSALVLDSGSFTHIKSGGAIYVKQNGSLVIKNHAFVQIGDSGTCGWGEVIAEPGAFVHVEPMAHIEFRRTIADTVDRNYFVIATERTGSGTAFNGVHFVIDTILKLDTILPILYTSADICSLDSINPIKNKAFGYANFAAPLATFSARNDTLCPREPLHIKLNRILNDAQVQIKVCRMDSVLVVDDGSGFTHWKDTCIADSIPLNLTQPDPVCTPPRLMPDEWTYFFKPNTLNRVTISVINDCGKRHDTTAYIYAADTPKISIYVPDSACEGFGGFAVTASNRTQLPVKYAYEVSEYFTDTQSLLIGILNPSEVYSFSAVGIVPDSFVFSNYYFKGGRSYIVSLSISNECNSFDVYDTIHIQSGAAILLSKPNAYAEPINGPKSVKLTAITKQADSLNWQPALWLNRTDTAIVISTPNDSIGYILTAYSGGCLSRDTAIIKYNRVANAGLNDTLCFTNDTALLGNSYDMSIFLAWLYYLGGDNFRDMFTHYTGNQIDYFRYFTHFMMHEEKFKQWENACTAEIVKTYNNQIHRRAIFNLPWFKNYYAVFTAFNDANMGAFDYFKTQIETDAGLMANLSGFLPWPVMQDCVNEMFYYYDDFLSNNLQEITSSWIKISQNDTTVLTTWDEYFVAMDNPQQTSIYIQTVITPQYAEIDEVTVYRDTVLVPYFYAAMQFDSTIYFANTTSPYSQATTFSWNFGDGLPISNLAYPIHTFAAFDTSYVVCLTAFNKCGSFMYCDTIRIDSALLNNQRMSYNNGAGLTNKYNQDINNEKRINNTTNRQEILITNYPNPFGDKTIIDYQIWQPFTNALLVITNTFGQVIHEQKLVKPIDKVTINANDFASGLYYYSVVVDNATKVTKMMSVIH